MNRRLALLSLLGCITPSLAHGQEASPEPAPAMSGAPGADQPAEVEELVVTGGRPRGAVLSDIPPEVTFNAAEVRAMGVSSMTDLLAELTPQSTSGRGGSPVVLLNGRRVSSFNELKDIPTEAIQRVEVLPEEVALKYGYTADQKVVNVVLRQRFRAVTGEFSLAAPTAGGQTTEQVDANSLRLNRDGRVNLAVRFRRSDALLESDRNLRASQTGGLYDLAGNLTSSPTGGEIDPALSALVGVPVTVAGAPALAAARAPGLADFVATANQANVSDISDSRSLLPKTDQLSVNTVVNRFIFGDVSATLNASASLTDTTALLGPARAQLVVPAGDPFSPFGQDVTLYRYLGRLSQDSRNWTGHLGGTLNGDSRRWRWSLTGNYDHAETRTLTGRGVDVTGLQARLDAQDPTLNPFAPITSLATLTDRAVSASDTGNAQLVVNGALYRLPAGDLSTSVKLGTDATRFDATSRRAGVETTSDLWRGGVNGQISFDAPIASRKTGVAPRLGDLSANLNLAVNQLSDFGALTTLGYGLTWSPVTPVSFIASMTRQERAPTIQQLGNPLVTTPDARVFDYVKGQTVDVTSVSGGNRDLKPEDRRVLKLGLTLRPPKINGLSVSADYFRTRIDDPIASFPTATAAIEAAFPDRFTRDADGDLLRIDSRPVNFARQESDQLRWGLNFSRQIGKSPPPGRDGFRRRETSDTRPGPPAAAGQPPSAAPAADRPPGAELLQGALAQDRTPPSDPGASPSPPVTGDAVRANPPQGAGPRSGGPGGFGGGPGFGGGSGSGATRVQLTIYQTIHLRERIAINDAVPVLDLLDGDAVGSNGGQPRHEIEAQAGITKNGLGARMTANWRSATTVRGGGAPGAPTTLRFSDLTTVNLRLFANLGAQRDLVAAYPTLRGTRVSVSCTNLFDSHIRVRDGSGSTPIKYQADYLDPLGRSVQLSVRKVFF
ncbi:TonB-dependent receptor [Phenylobacterium sp. LjRoot225]|uniref:TonB-dependent receptor n=1 Tax=Phenylobacterium sp. LjRoot225 TaxID=3342285 RepID=UPI003ECC283E